MNKVLSLAKYLSSVSITAAAIATTICFPTKNDFIGFVLGYDDDDLFGTNSSTDYILIDGKQGTQAGWEAGMTI